MQEVVGYLFLVGSNIHPVDGCLAAELQSWNSHGEDDHASFYSDDTPFQSEHIAHMHTNNGKRNVNSV